VRDLVRSAFGHAGQKCSAASLAIVEASVYDDPSFLPRVADATRSMKVGVSSDLATVVGPLIRPPDGPLADALGRLDEGESWLLAPRRLDDAGYMWSPGVKVGVRRGSRFHVLGWRARECAFIPRLSTHDESRRCHRLKLRLGDVCQVDGGQD
jgi:RHH-type proline utilization regulon transcriptional repressor/proline dehydrogenase/delta 1-pyrroline-5-carboxylate dehydrogenase